MLQTLDKDRAHFGMTLGTVVDSNDPQQMGRLRISCPFWGDPVTPDENQLKKLPWINYIAPFGGSTSAVSRGTNGETTSGQVAYGMWNIPKKGSDVIVLMLDGDSQHRYYFGSVLKPHTPHTMPHGRYLDSSDPSSTNESAIEPLSSNQKSAFGGTGAYEWRSRAADYSASAVDAVLINGDNQYTTSNIADDKDIPLSIPGHSRTTKRTGYAKDPNTKTDLNEHADTGGTPYDSSVYSWVTPGFHAISMDDRPENCRMRMRSTGGHQVILDDTNERIYISTAQGKTWIEIDEKGCVDIFGEQDISIRTEADMNFTADQTIRFNGKEGIHFATDKEFRVHAQEEINLKTATNLRTFSATDTYIESGANLHIKSGAELYTNSVSDMHIKTDANLYQETGAAFHIKSGSTINLESSATIDFKAGGAMSQQAGGAVTIDGSTVGINDGGSAGSASPATAATNSETKESYLVTRVPEHEPWARVYMTLGADNDSGNSQTPEYGYEDANVGKGSAERGKDFNRNPNWSR